MTTGDYYKKLTNLKFCFGHSLDEESTSFCCRLNCPCLYSTPFKYVNPAHMCLGAFYFPEWNQKSNSNKTGEDQFQDCIVIIYAIVPLNIKALY